MCDSIAMYVNEEAKDVSLHGLSFSSLTIRLIINITVQIAQLASLLIKV